MDSDLRMLLVMQYIDLPINHPCQVLAVLHHPGNFAPLASLLGPLALLVRVLFKQHKIVGEVNVVHSRFLVPLDAALVLSKQFLVCGQNLF